MTIKYYPGEPKENTFREIVDYLNTEAPHAVVPTPVGYRWTAHPLTLRRVSSGVITDFTPSDYIPSIVNTWYVDPVSGNDGTAAVNNRSLPLKNLSTALAKTDVDQIRIINLTTDYFARTTASWNFVQPSRSVSIINEGPGRFVSLSVGSASLPTWVVNGTYSNVYSTTITSANATGVTDLFARTEHPSVSEEKVAARLSNVARPYRVLKKVASLAAVNAEAGTWFHDGTQLHVRPHDDRSLVGDTLMQPTASTNNGRFTSTVANLTIYIDGIDFVGGRPFYATVVEASAPANCVLVATNCTFQNGGVANGIAIEFPMSVYLYRCGAFNNWNDGFNYHCPTAPAAAGAATSPNVIEIECVAYGNGLTGSSATSDNASTAHEYTNIIRLDGVYYNSDDRVVVDIDNVHSWNIDSYIGGAIQIAAGKESIASLNNARMWLDTITAGSTTNAKWLAAQTSVLKHYNSGTVVNSGTGEATGTTKFYLG